MKFLVISQRSIPNPQYRLNDLTAHGRIDVLFRCILAACRPLFQDQINEIYCYLKGHKDPSFWGWIHVNENLVSEDEISVAAKIQKNWSEYFRFGNLEDLVNLLNPSRIYFLDENGEKLDLNKHEIGSSLVILGAQNDPSLEDLHHFENYKSIKLHDQPLLASQVILLLKQKILYSQI